MRDDEETFAERIARRRSEGIEFRTCSLPVVVGRAGESSADINARLRRDLRWQEVERKAADLRRRLARHGIIPTERV